MARLVLDYASIAARAWELFNMEEANPPRISRALPTAGVGASPRFQDDDVSSSGFINFGSARAWI